MWSTVSPSAGDGLSTNTVDDDQSKTFLYMLTGSGPSKGSVPVTDLYSSRYADGTASALPTFTEGFASTAKTLVGISAEVTSDVLKMAPNKVKGHLGDVFTKSEDLYTTAGPPEDSGGLTPMMKWFIATGTIILLVLVLIVVNCCINFKERLAKTMKDVKRYTETEKRVHREQFQASDLDGDRGIKTHVFMHWFNKKGYDQNHC